VIGDSSRVPEAERDEDEHQARKDECGDPGPERDDPEGAERISLEQETRRVVPSNAVVASALSAALFGLARAAALTLA